MAILNNIKTKQHNVVISLFVLIFVLNWMEILFIRDEFNPFHSSQFNSYNFESYVFDVFLFVLPFLLHWFSNDVKIAFDVLLFYASYVFLSFLLNCTINVSNTGFNSMTIIGLLPSTFPYFYVLRILLFGTTAVYLIVYRIKFNANRLDVWLILILSVLVLLFWHNIYLIFVLIGLAILIFVAILLWDILCILKSFISNEQRIGVRTYFKQKAIIACLPFLVLLPWFAFLNDVLLIQSDQMGPNHSIQPNAYYHALQCMFHSLPGIVAYLLYCYKSRSMEDLKPFKLNLYLTVLLNYFLVYIYILMDNFSKSGY